MTERGHDSNQPLLQKNDGKRNLSTRLKISLFAFLGGVAIEMRSISQTTNVFRPMRSDSGPAIITIGSPIEYITSCINAL
jgi:hypothetical protein